MLCWSAGPHLHKDLQQIAGTVQSPLMLQMLHHHPHSKEIQNYRTTWLRACSSNICGHEVIWKTGAGPPEGHHWTLAGSSSVCLQSKQVCILLKSQRIIGTTLPTPQELYLSRVSKRAGKITLDPSHPAHAPSLNSCHLFNAPEFWAPECTDTGTVSSLRQSISCTLDNNYGTHTI